MARTSDTQVLIVEPDARTRAALGALIDATPGLHVAATTGSAVDALAVVAVGDTAHGTGRVLAAGATAVSDKHGDPRQPHCRHRGGRPRTAREHSRRRC